jgi:hypothetical protein
VVCVLDVRSWRLEVRKRGVSCRGTVRDGSIAFGAGYKVQGSRLKVQGLGSKFRAQSSELSIRNRRKNPRKQVMSELDQNRDKFRSDPQDARLGFE